MARVRVSVAVLGMAVTGLNVSVGILSMPMRRHLGAVVSVCVLAPNVSPKTSNSAWPLSRPTGIRPRRSGRLNVVEPSPGP